MTRALFDVGDHQFVASATAVAPAHVVHVCHNRGCHMEAGKWSHSNSPVFQASRFRAHDPYEPVRILP